MDVDLNAPLVARREVFIETPIQDVWRILSDVERWPTWQPDVDWVRLNGTLQPGSVFHWRVRGVRVRSTLRAVEAPRHIGWVSLTPGMRAVHVFTFESHRQRTRVVTEESRSGWSTRTLKLMSPHFIEPLLETWLELLKARAERGP